MYNSSYSRAKLAPDTLHRSRGKSCGYYMRIVFFFSSLIQSLIIVSLVLFLIYGQPEKSAEEKRVEVSGFFLSVDKGAAASLGGARFHSPSVVVSHHEGPGGELQPAE